MIRCHTTPLGVAITNLAAAFALILFAACFTLAVEDKTWPWWARRLLQGVIWATAAAVFYLLCSPGDMPAGWPEG